MAKLLAKIIRYVLWLLLWAAGLWSLKRAEGTDVLVAWMWIMLFFTFTGCGIKFCPRGLMRWLERQLCE